MPKDIQKPKLFLVGAGPGDPELLTIKALRVLNQVDLVLFDNLVNRKILDYIENPKTQKEFSGKSIGESFKQENINQTILKALKQGLNVARLKGGDPLVFARGAEEAQIALEHGYEVEFVPGLTTAFSAAALNNKTLTLREKTDTVIVATGHELNEAKFKLWLEALKQDQVLVLYMGLRNIVEITTRLNQELGKDFPITAIYKASLLEQKILDSNLERISQDLINNNFESPVIFYIGKNLNHLKQYHEKTLLHLSSSQH